MKTKTMANKQKRRDMGNEHWKFHLIPFLSFCWIWEGRERSALRFRRLSEAYLLRTESNWKSQRFQRLIIERKSCGSRWFHRKMFLVSTTSDFSLRIFRWYPRWLRGRQNKFFLSISSWCCTTRDWKNYWGSFRSARSYKRSWGHTEKNELRFLSKAICRATLNRSVYISFSSTLNPIIIFVLSLNTQQKSLN